MYVCMHACTHIYIDLYSIDIYVYRARGKDNSPCLRWSPPIHIYTYIHIHKYIYTCICIYVCIHTHIYIPIKYTYICI